MKDANGWRKKVSAYWVTMRLETKPTQDYAESMSVVVAEEPRAGGLPIL